ncbi:MAG: acetylglutamate kinase [Planctomycetota bacterium]|nr:MAG: acetylglutamate kinase [Planctomycetota bacterium]REK21293.1 MAG: acetylglutamate kinase [Planctomycetota bacterium]REK32086.1 MAG: acetylglutamate kinase [Planctomycetota bacterium]
MAGFPAPQPFSSGQPPLDDAIQKARVLTEALGWIRQFRDRYVIVKLGGSALEDPDSARNCLRDVIFMEAVGMRPILVHGGGKAISRAMASAGIEPRFVQGRRYTDEATLDIAARVLCEEVCESVVDEIRSQGGRAVGLNYTSENVLVGEKLQLAGENGEPVDLGSVGQVCDLHRDMLLAICRSGTIPVLPSIALDQAGNRLNVNADTAAAAVARLLKAEKLVFLSDVPGIFMDRHDPSTLLSHLRSQQVRELIDKGVIDSGMVPKVDAAIEALQAGVKKVHIIDARIPHSILLEVYSDVGIGTEIVN